MGELKNVNDIRKIKLEKGRIFHSATHEEIINGFTSDLYFVRTRELLPGKEAGSPLGLCAKSVHAWARQVSPNVQIFVSGGINTERIPALLESRAAAFGVGSYISVPGLLI